MRKHLKIEKQNKKPNPQSSAAYISVVLEGCELGCLSEKTSPANHSGFQPSGSDWLNNHSDTSYSPTPFKNLLSTALPCWTRDCGRSAKSQILDPWRTESLRSWTFGGQNTSCFLCPVPGLVVSSSDLCKSPLTGFPAQTCPS